MTSHEWANNLINMANFLLSRPEFTVPSHMSKAHERLDYFSDKTDFVAAAKAIGGKKYFPTESWNADEFHIVNETDSFKIVLEIKRTAICRLVKPAQPAEYDCEPLLSADEEAEIAGSGSAL